MKRNNFSDFCIVLLLYIAVSAIPFGRFIVGLNWLVFVFQIVMQLGFFVFLYWYLKNKTELNLKSKGFNLKKTLILIPTLLVCFSNFIYLLFITDEFHVAFSSSLIFEIILLAVKALNEEIIFRLVLLNNLESESKFKNILISAAVFAAMHIINLVNGISVAVLLQVLYTFGLGLLFGVIFYFSGSLIPCVVVHMLFNIMNDSVFNAVNAGSNMLAYILVNAGVALVVAIYVIVILFIKKEIIFKEEKTL